jgi:hypothetical protein
MEKLSQTAKITHDEDYWYAKLAPDWQKHSKKLVEEARREASVAIEQKAQNRFYKHRSLKKGEEVRFLWQTPLSPVGLHISVHKPKTIIKSVDFEYVPEFVWMEEKEPRLSRFSPTDTDVYVLGWMMFPVEFSDSRIRCPYDDCHISVAIYSAEITRP